MQLNKIIVLSCALFSNAFAADIQPAGTQDYLFPPAGKAQFTAPKKIKLLRFKLSDTAINTLKQKANSVHQKKTFMAATATNSAHQLGMNDVPVLDQGSFGSCVTFADTAAIDAALGKGDYVSQLCLLQLGNYATKYAFSESGWDGSFNRRILSRLEDHGFISKEQQRTQGCGGLTEYPNNEAIPESSISFDAYHQLSEGLAANGITWTPILDSYRALYVNDGVDTNTIISDIKNSIDSEHRVTMASFLPAVDLGVAGAVGKNQTQNDTWVLSSLIERELYLNNGGYFAGHAMVITGYDDNAVAVDDAGREHVGLFTLRNSWGAQRGNQGDFYMSYDYFRVLGMEADQIKKDNFFVIDDENNEPEDDDDDDSEE